MQLMTDSRGFSCSRRSRSPRCSRSPRRDAVSRGARPVAVMIPLEQSVAQPLDPNVVVGEILPHFPATGSSMCAVTKAVPIRRSV